MPICAPRRATGVVDVLYARFQDHATCETRPHLPDPGGVVYFPRMQISTTRSEILKRLHGIVILGEPDQARDCAMQAPGAVRALGTVRAPLTAWLGV